MNQQFSHQVLAWYDIHGRKNLPWQGQNAYRVWLSEIMLQQTQVKTVIPYYQRFIEHYPTVTALAKAPLDDVLTLWAGLGYYARARRCHECAQIIASRYGGEFPADLAALSALPGIGRSTAGAILAMAFHQKATILDGNVKRVLCRYAGIEGTPSTANTQRQLWVLAETFTPSKRVAEYTQAIMDLGATLCTRSKPACSSCPVKKTCFAFQHDKTDCLPVQKNRITLPRHHKQFLILQDKNHRVLLTKRPAQGVWGGLWSLPEYDMSADLRYECKRQWGLDIHIEETLASIQHTFSHFHLMITPVTASIVHHHQLTVLDHQRYFWYPLSKSPTLGVAKPIKDILADLKRQFDLANVTIE